MKKTNKVVSAVLFCLVVTAAILLPGCKDDEIESQVMILGHEKIMLMNRQDSLMRLLTERRVAYDTLTSGYNSLSDDNKALLARLRSLQSGYNARGEQIKKAEEVKIGLDSVIARQNAENDSLNNVIASLTTKIDDLNNTVSAAEAEKNALADIIKVKDTRIAADSIAEVSRLSQPREYGFVDILSVAGGIGLGNKDYDYENRLISVDNIFGYRINRKFLTGLGAGIHFYDGGVLLPLFLDLRYTFKQGSIKPFLSADGGFLITPEKFTDTNTFLQPMIGLSKRTGLKSYMHISTGLTIIQTPQPDRYRSSFFTIKGSFSFSGKKGPEI